MPYPEESTTSAADKIRSIRVKTVDWLWVMDARYLYQCFNENAEVLAATVVPGSDVGFVEFASHSMADMVLNSYNGEPMPNFNNMSFCLDWDTDGYGTFWRWNDVCQFYSFHGYDEWGHQLCAQKMMEIEHELDKDSILFVDLKPSVGDPKHLEPEDMHRFKTVTPKLKEKELYLCFNEVNLMKKSCYVFRSIKLSELLACSCEFSFKTRTLTECKYCTSKSKPEFLLRQRAWIFPWENFPVTGGSQDQKIPVRMGCCTSGSQIFFAGGMVPPPDPETQGGYVPSGDFYSFTPESTSWQKHDWSFEKEKPHPLLFEVNGNFYCLAGQPPVGVVEHPTFEVYNSSTGKCEVLPDPPFYELERDGECCMRTVYGMDLSYAIVGSKILISTKANGNPCPEMPIMCLDVNDKEKKWREMPSLFGGERFPFVGRALVLDVKDGTHVMFSFREGFIYASLLHSSGDGSICISDDECAGGFATVHTLMRYFSPQSYVFVDLGDQKVGFVLCGNDHVVGDCVDGLDPCRKARVLVMVIEYEVTDSNDLMSNILASRTFDYNCHSPSIFCTKLVGSLVV